jgi:hypothetical protein
MKMDKKQGVYVKSNHGGATSFAEQQARLIDAANETGASLRLGGESFKRFTNELGEYGVLMVLPKMFGEDLGSLEQVD